MISKYFEKIWRFIFKENRKKMANKTDNDNISSDVPLIDPLLDRFSRYPFSKRLAEIIVNRSDINCVVYGLYGEWGTGKSTVLNFIDIELNKSRDVIPIKFNPWLFQDESTLMQGFFSTLVEALGRSMQSQKEKIGGFLKKYSAAIIPLSVSVGGVVTINPSDSLTALGENLSSKTIEEEKKQFEKILEQEGKRVVIFMDDIDRLDKKEIAWIFKLVKLAADFKYTSYVLSFDEKMVAAALSEQYAGDNRSGHNFLEKIVQVPLHLPYIPEFSKRRFFEEQISGLLKSFGTSLDPDDEKRFYQEFMGSLWVFIKSPRMVKRYVNALSFSLPLLKNEVNKVDLMLVEGLRVLLPDVYERIRLQPEIFLGGNFGHYVPSDISKEYRGAVINGLFVGFSEIEKQGLKSLLSEIFPAVISIIGGFGHYARNSDEYEKQQRVCSPYYFNRFFNYAIPDDDIPDTKLSAMLSTLETANQADAQNEVSRTLQETNVENFLLKVSQRRSTLSGKQSKNLALSITNLKSIFPNYENTFVFASPSYQAAQLVALLILNIPKGSERIDLIKEIIGSTDVDRFLFYFLRGMSPGTEDPPDLFFSGEDRIKISEAVNQKVKSTLGELAPWKLFGGDTSLVLTAWAYWNTREAPNQYLLSYLDRNPLEVFALLKCFFSEQQDRIFAGDRYKSLSSIIDLSELRRRLNVQLEARGADHDIASEEESYSVDTFLKIYDQQQGQNQTTDGSQDASSTSR